MAYNLIFALAAAVTPTVVSAPAPAPAVTRTVPEMAADKAWDAYQASLHAPVPESTYAMQPSKRDHEMDLHAQAISAAALNYYLHHPSDPRRWDAATTFLKVRPAFYTAFKPGYDTSESRKDAVIDVSATAAYDREAAAIKAAANSTTDLPETTQAAIAQADIVGRLGEFDRTSPQADWDRVAGELRAMTARFPKVDKVENGVRIFGVVYAEYHTDAEVSREWATFESSPNAAVSERAAMQARAYALLANPLDIKFTAIDGRAVDLAKLRGKVVLIDFWATWCGPCKAEIPNLRAAYAKYHDKGFEVVGISLDESPDGKPDPAKKTAAQVLDFTRKNNMPWPQFYDGKRLKNAISSRYGIEGIPAMYLLDQRGRVVSRNARGPKLEAELKRLLQL